jgi:DNA-binding winged helix-turn-helix (wHTH) protein
VAVLVRFGDFVFDSDTRVVRRGRTVVPLGPKAFALLEILIEERPRALSKSELMDRLWPDVVVSEANLKNVVHEVRSALGSRGVIRTVNRYGYAFGSDGTPEPAGTPRLVDRETTHRLAAGPSVIGRDPDCEIVLDYTGISRQHARITVRGSDAVIEDLGSKNGTWVNEVRIEGEARLQDGDRIRFGGVPLTFRSGNAVRTTTTLLGNRPERS